MDWVFSILPKENWQYTERNAKIYFNGKFVSYPFELSLCELDEEDAVECVHDFMLSQQGQEPSNFRDWLSWNFGEGIANYYMIPYNEKYGLILWNRWKHNGCKVKCRFLQKRNDSFRLA